MMASFAVPVESYVDRPQESRVLPISCFSMVPSWLWRELEELLATVVVLEPLKSDCKVIKLMQFFAAITGLLGVFRAAQDDLFRAFS